MHYDSSKLVAALRDTKGRSHQPWHSRIVGLILFAVAAAAYAAAYLLFNSIDVFGLPIEVILSLVGGAVVYMFWQLGQVAKNYAPNAIDLLGQVAKSIYAPNAIDLLRKDRRRLHRTRETGSAQNPNRPFKEGLLIVICQTLSMKRENKSLRRS